MQKLTPVRPPYTGSGDWMNVFLPVLRNTGNVRYASMQAGISRMTAYTRRKKDSNFAALWDEAMEDAVDHLEGVAWEKAKGGDNTLLIFLLKSHRRSVYGDATKLEHSGPDGQPIKTQDASPDLSHLTNEELEQLEKLIDTAEKRRQEAMGNPPPA